MADARIQLRTLTSILIIFASYTLSGHHDKYKLTDLLDDLSKSNCTDFPPEEYYNQTTGSKHSVLSSYCIETEDNLLDPLETELCSIVLRGYSTFCSLSGKRQFLGDPGMLTSEMLKKMKTENASTTCEDIIPLITTSVKYSDNVKAFSIDKKILATCSETCKKTRQETDIQTSSLCVLYLMLILARPTLVDGVQDHWTTWSDCSAKCGSGLSTRTRQCLPKYHEFVRNPCPSEKKTDTDTICHETICECTKPPPEIKIGEIDQATATNGSVTYKCPAGYSIRGKVTNECQADGTWEKPAATCKELICPELTTSVGNAQVSYVKQVHGSEGNTANITCVSGYYFKNKANSMISVCVKGKWRPAPPKECTAVDCGPLPNIKNGIAKAAQRTRYDSPPAVIQCKEGYRIKDGGTAETIICLQSGVWELPPTCIENNCKEECKEEHKTCDKNKIPAACVCKSGYKEEKNGTCTENAGITNSAGITDNSAKITATASITETAKITATASITETAKITETANITATAKITETANTTVSEKADITKIAETTVGGMNYYTYLLIFAILSIAVGLLIYFRTTIKHIFGCDNNSGSKYRHGRVNLDGDDPDMEKLLGSKQDLMKDHVY